MNGTLFIYKNKNKKHKKFKNPKFFYKLKKKKKKKQKKKKKTNKQTNKQNNKRIL